MSNTNFIGAIVKILETPKQTIIKKGIVITTFRVQFPEFRKDSIVLLKIWGNLGHDLVRYYKVDDYILIEGYLAIKFNKNRKLQPQRRIQITVFKVYPFFF